MGKRDSLFFLTCFILLTLRTWAGANIGFGYTTVSGDTLKPDDTLVINTSLINYGPGTFSGTVGFNFAINGVQNVNRSIFNDPIQDQTIRIEANDSFPLEFHVVVQKQYLVPGSDIFVVWPIIANGDTVRDSLTIHMNVSAGDPTGINEPGSMPEIKLYYNGQSVVIDYPPQPAPLQIRIFNIEGREVYTARTEGSCSISFYNQANGVYFVDVSLTGDIPRVFKVVKLDR